MATLVSSDEKIDTLPRRPWLNRGVKAKNSPGTTEAAMKRTKA